MKHRSLPKMFGLFIITFGVYRLYWLTKTRKELLKQRPDAKILTPWLLFLPYILIAVSIIALIAVTAKDANMQRNDGCVLATTSNATTSDKQVTDLSNEEARTVSGKPCETSLPVGIVLLFYVTCASFLPITAAWMWGYSKAVDRVTEEKLSFAISMLILLLIPDGFDMLIIQDSFNKLAQKKEKKPKSPVPAAA